MVSVNPTTGETLATYPTLDEAGIEARLVKAADALRRYRLTPFAERARIPTRAVNILEGEREALGRGWARRQGTRKRGRLQSSANQAGGGPTGVTRAWSGRRTR